MGVLRGDSAQPRKTSAQAELGRGTLRNENRDDCLGDPALEPMTERPSLRGLRFRGLGGRDASLFPLTNTFMESSLSPDSSVYSKESAETNFMMYRV
jgi:hypothetical protein